jgi:hypothetical protein
MEDFETVVVVIDSFFGITTSHWPWAFSRDPTWQVPTAV